MNKIQNGFFTPTEEGPEPGDKIKDVMMG